MRVRWYTPFCWLAALAFAGFAVRAALIDLRHNRPAEAKADQLKDFALRGDARFGRLRPALPSFGVAGYLAGSTGSHDADNQHYILAQYALAPLILRRSTEARFIAANFPDSATLRQTLRDYPTLRVIWEDPRIGGLAVLENLAPPADSAAPSTEAKPSN